MILELGSEIISDKLPNSSINSYFNWENQINWNGILLNSWVPELHGRFIHANVVRRPRRVIQKSNIQIFIGFTTLFSYACFLLGWFFRLEKGTKIILTVTYDGTYVVAQNLNDLMCTFHMLHITCLPVTWFHLMSLDVPEW